MSERGHGSDRAATGAAARPAGGVVSATRALEQRLFGQHNPLYAFSALCIIAGVYIVGRELEQTAGGRVLLAFVLELYSALLIAGAAVLRRARQERSAATLGLFAAFFLIDPTLRVEGMVTSDAIASVALGLWCVVALLKLQLLARVFALRVPWHAFGPFVVALLGTVLVPWLARALPAERELLAIHVSFVGALLVAFAALAPWRVTAIAAGLGGGAVAVPGASPAVLPLLNRSLGAVQWLVVLGYHGHAAVTLHAHEVPVGMLLFVPYLALLPALAARERRIWQLAALALLLACATPLTLAPTAVLLCAALLFQYRRRGFARLLVGAVLAAYLGVWLASAPSHAALAAPALWLQLCGAGVQLALAYRLRLWPGLPAAVLCLAPSLRGHGPPDPLQLGIAVLVLGFAALALGIWRDARRAHRAQNG